MAYKGLPYTVRFIYRLLLITLSFIPYFVGVSSVEAASETIKMIEVNGIHRIDEEEFSDLININTGHVLDRVALRRGIRRAFEKGIFLDIEALSEPYEDGIKLIFIVKEVPVVEKITIEGTSAISSRKIRQIYFFHDGEDFREEYTDRAHNALAAFYRRKGFPDVKVTTGIEHEPGRAGVRIHVIIEEGSPEVIAKVDALPEVRHIMTLAKGSIFDRDEMDKNIRKIKEYYRKNMYLNPVVGPYSFHDGILDVPVETGRRLEMTFHKNFSIAAKKLKKELSLMAEEEITDESISEAADRIKRLYVSEGYYNVQVEAGVEWHEDVIKIDFTISEGEKILLNKILFTGISINPRVLKNIIPLSENKPYNDNLLSDCRESIVNFYNALGYLQADVLSIKKEFLEHRNELNLEIDVEEGQQTTISSISIDGNAHISTMEIIGSLSLKEGSPYNTVDITDARQRLHSLYNRYGYLDAAIELESRIDMNKAFLAFHIEENKQSIIGKIILRGNRKTKAKIIRREITLDEGDPYDYDEITATKQRLYKLGIFNEVSIEALAPGVAVNNEVIRDMLISVKEGKRGTVEFSIGYGDYEQLRGAIDIRYRNIGGYNRQAGFRTEMSSVEKKYIFNFREPWLFNWPDVPLKVYLIREEKRGLNIETREVLYKIDKQSLIVGVEKELHKGLTAGLDYEYSFTDTKDVQEDVILSKEDTGTVGIGSLSPSLYYDSRDDLFDPHSGAFQSVVVKYASSAFLSEIEFIKGSFQSSWYVQLLKHLVFAFSFRGGAGYGFGATEELPLIERFFLGGRSTVRGYKQDALGPKGADDNPTGGNVFALTNWELRYAIGKGFGLVAFIDAGNVWKTIGDVEDSLKYTVGGGLRYGTPIGPLRIDYGHKMNREEGESAGEVHFSFGHAF